MVFGLVNADSKCFGLVNADSLGLGFVNADSVSFGLVDVDIVDFALVNADSAGFALVIDILNILPLFFHREMIDIKLLFKSLFVSDISASLLSDYKPDSKLWSSQNGSLFYSRQVWTKSFNSFIQIEWSVFGIDYQRICVKNNLRTALYVK